MLGTEVATGTSTSSPVEPGDPTLPACPAHRVGRKSLGYDLGLGLGPRGNASTLRRGRTSGRCPASTGCAGWRWRPSSSSTCRPDGLPGGFLGVDLFFVLSGFLITSLLVLELDARRDARGGGRVDLGRFWVRRARRLLPALFITLVGVTLAARRWLPGWELDHIRSDGFAALAYISNWHDAWRDVAYFDTASSPSPFAHLWSLAIEEQIYLLWPLALLALHRLTRGRRGTARGRGRRARGRVRHRDGPHQATARSPTSRPTPARRPFSWARCWRSWLGPRARTRPASPAVAGAWPEQSVWWVSSPWRSSCTARTRGCTAAASPLAAILGVLAVAGATRGAGPLGFVTGPGRAARAGPHLLRHLPLPLARDRVPERGSHRSRRLAARRGPPRLGRGADGGVVQTRGATHPRRPLAWLGRAHRRTARRRRGRVPAGGDRAGRHVGALLPGRAERGTRPSPSPRRSRSPPGRSPRPPRHRRPRRPRPRRPPRTRRGHRLSGS